MKTLHTRDRQEWRAWLQDNHDTETEIWLVFYKKHTGQPSVPYEDAVEEALCFGWIDSLVNTIDADRYVQKFTPRRMNSKWSETNKRRVLRLIEQGLMTEAGLSKITFPMSGFAPEHEKQAPNPVEEVPDLITEGLMANPAARENFNRLAPSHRANYIKWIMSARREATRQKRLAEAIALLEQNQKLGLK